MPNFTSTPSNSPRPGQPAPQQTRPAPAVFEMPSRHASSSESDDQQPDAGADDFMLSLLASPSWHGSDGALEDGRALLLPLEGFPGQLILSSTSLGAVQQDPDDLEPIERYALRAARPAPQTRQPQETEVADDADDAGQGLPPIPQLPPFDISQHLLPGADIQSLRVDNAPNVSFQWDQHTSAVSAATLEWLLIACEPPTPLQLQNSRSE